MDETTTAQADPPGSRTATLPARMVGRSVVGFDGSAASATALDWAVARAAHRR